MKIHSIFYSSSFKKSVKKYASHQKKIEGAITMFMSDPFEPSLKTYIPIVALPTKSGEHTSGYTRSIFTYEGCKLTGKFGHYWSFSIDYQLRILFEFIDEKTAGFINMGTHEIYK